MSEHIGKTIEFAGVSFERDLLGWYYEKANAGGYKTRYYLIHAVENGDEFISHLLSRAETAERERDEAQAKFMTEIAQSDDAYCKLNTQAVNLKAERDALRAQLDASTQSLQFTAEERKKAWENMMVKMHAFPCSSESHTFRKTNDYIDALCAGRRVAKPVLALLPAQKPVARELTREEIDAIAKEMYSSAPLPEQVINACIRHTCKVAQPIALPSDMEIAQGLEDAYCHRQGAMPVRLVTDSSRCDARLAQVAYVRSLIEGKVAPTPEQPAPDREKVIELARDLCTLNTHMTHEELFEYSEDFLAAADAYRKGE